MAGGLFDDVPNVGGGQMTAAAPGGLFADVAADPVAAVKWGDIVDPKQAKAQIDTLPEPARQRARDIWATSAVARDREGGGVMQRVDDSVRRFAKNAPAIGSWADELNAWTASVFGSDYDLAHAYERAKDRAIDAAPTQKLGTLPLVGDVTTGGLEQAAGVVAGAVALPMAKLVQARSAVATAVNVAANAGVVGAVQGAGEGTNAAERASNAAISGGLSAAGGAVLGGAIGKLTGQGAPAAVANRVASNEAAAAAQRVGVDLPVAAAGTPNGVPMMVGSVLKEVPVAGAPLVAAVDKASEQLATAGQRIADKVAPGVTPMSAGYAARNGITQWITTGSTRELDNLYSGVRAMVPDTFTRPLAATRAAAQTLLAADNAAASSVNGRAVAVIEDAITRPQGLTYEGLLQLRTNVGHMIDDGLLPEAGTMKPALKRIYGALSDDLRDLVRQGGGRPAEAAWTRANNATRLVEHQREALTKIIGFEGRAAPEQVLDRLVQYAGSRSSADIRTLIRARNVLPPGAWDEVSAAAVGRLGRNQANDFSPAIFLKNYSALSQNGKNVLFGRQQAGGVLRNDLDALARTAESYQNLAKLQNSSGSGRVVVGAMALFSGTLAPAALPFIALKGIGARMIAEALAKPVTVKPINRFAQNLYNVLESGKGQAALKFSTLTLAKVLADKVGGNEKEIAAAIDRETAALLAPASSPSAPGGGGPAVPPPSPVGTPGQPVAPGGDTLEAAPNDQAARAAFLSSEKDRRPYAETFERGMIAPLGINGFTGKAEPAIPQALGGGGWQTMHDARTGQNSVTQRELDNAATDLAGVAMTGTIAGRSARAPAKPAAPPPPSPAPVAPPPPSPAPVAPPPPSREVASPPPAPAPVSPPPPAPAPVSPPPPSREVAPPPPAPAPVSPPPPSREVAPPPPAPAPVSPPPPGAGPAPGREPQRIVTPDGSMEVQAVPELVELATLREATGKFQPRDRNRAEYLQEARERASRLDPEQLGSSRVSDSGAPIVLEDGTVISGNGRVMSIDEVYHNPAMQERLAAYRASLGPNAAGMQQPVLIMRARGLAGDDAARFADLSNRGRIAGMSATERAQRDAAALGDGLALYQGGDFGAPQNHKFVQHFMTNVASRSERATLSKDAELTLEGAQRMRNAILAAAYDDAPVLARMLESTDDNIRSISGALTDAAPKFSALKADIKAGAVLAEMDPTAEITAAVKLIADLRTRRVKAADHFAQKDAFGGTSPVVEQWVRAFYNDDLSRASSREKMRTLLEAYAEEAAKHRPGGLFPDETKPGDVLKYARKAASDGEGQTIGGTNGGLVESVQKSGAEAQGHQTDKGGPSAGEPSAPKTRNQREKVAEQKFELDEWRAAYFAATGKHASKDWSASVVRTKTKAAWGNDNG